MKLPLPTANSVCILFVFIVELDDGAYNPLWATKGFTQTFHFWKEHRRQQSTPLNAFLTYVTLPWWSIAKGRILYLILMAQILLKDVFNF